MRYFLINFCLQDTAEKAGLLNFNELQQVHFKMKVAQKHKLGYHVPKVAKLLKQPPSIARPVAGSDASSAANEDGERDVLSHQKIDVTGPSASQPQSNQSSTASWAHQPCPLTATTSRNVVNEDDLATTIAQLTYSRSAGLGVSSGGGGRDREGVTRTVQRWKMGLDLQQLIN
jgi:hypothetical protein